MALGVLCGVLALGCSEDSSGGGAQDAGGGAVTDGAGIGGGGGTGGTGGSGGSVGGSGGEGGVASDVPYEGPIPPLPASTSLDADTLFPIAHGAVWRYRKRSATPAEPEPVTQGGESTMVVTPWPVDPERLQAVRTTVTIFDLPPVGEEPGQKVRQVLEETLIIKPAEAQVGPQIKFAKLSIKEREVGTGKFVRTLTREYDPPYVMIEDAWRVGLIATSLDANPHVKETKQEHGEEQPTEQEYLAEVHVEMGTQEETLLMEGRWREHVRQVEVVDDVTMLPTRTFWVQKGIGIVQWVYRDATNLTFTLTESNLPE